MKETKTDKFLTLISIISIGFLPFIIGLFTSFEGLLYLWLLFDIYIILISLKIGFGDK